MVSQQEPGVAVEGLEFGGSETERALARQVFGLLRGRGRFMADEAPIRVSVESMAEFLAGQDGIEVGEATARIEAAAAANPEILELEERDGQRLVVTTRGGHRPVAPATDVQHSFAQRFMTPLPKPEKPPQPVRERPRVDPSWAALPALLSDLGIEEEEPEAETAVEDRTEVEAEVELVAAPEIAPVVPPVAAPTPPPETAPAAATAVERTPVVSAPPPVVEAAPAAAAEVRPAAAPPPVAPEMAPVAAEMAPAPAVAPVAPPVVAPPAPAPEPLTPAAAAAVPAPAPTPPVAASPPPPVATPVTPPAPPVRKITVPITALTDVSGVDDAELAETIRERLRADTRVATFGDQWSMEDRVPRFSRGDLRRFKDYLQEQEQPKIDVDLAQDVLGARPAGGDFELVRFAVNVRLQREHREFEFVGTADQRFWSTTGLPQIGTTRRKPNEIGTDYRFLIDEVRGRAEPRSVASIDRVLTFYEYLHGLLPFDAELQALLPAPLVPNQRAAVLTFECPQVYTTYLVELRYPTPNRGGFILGLDDFYTENLVPGAIVSLSRTENDGHYRVEYLAESGQSARLLELDERRAQRYVFRPTSYACGIEEGMLLTEERFGNLAGDKPLDDKARRRPEAVVAAAFERIGASRDGNYSAQFDALLAGSNIERPVSAALLRSILEHDDTGAFSRDPEGTDVYTYVPGTTP